MKIIINADDFGFTKSVNRAIIELASIGTVTSTTVMVNMPYVDDVLEIVKNQNVSIGLHINLTEGKPITAPYLIKSLVDKEGNFYNSDVLRSRLHKKLVKSDEVFIEIKNQYEILERLIGDKITHFDSHNDILKFNLIANALIKFKKSISRPMAVRVYHKSFVYLDRNDIYKIEKPGIKKIRKYGIKRLLVESLLNKHSRKLGKYFMHGNGFLLTDSLRAYDIFELIAENFNDESDNIYEICCHPAVDLTELPENILMETRIREYNLLKSESFKQVLKNEVLTNYSKIL